jgi:DNA-directed RNA polymerase subunit RPC12/RpoP
MAEHYTQTDRSRNLPVYPIYSCPVCNYPISGSISVEEEVHCPYCSSTLIAQDVTLPGWLIGGTIGLAIGLIFGPSIIASTEAGSQWLARKARAKIG